MTTEIHPDADEILTAVIETSDDAIFCLGPGGSIVSWTPMAERMFGYGIEEVLDNDFDCLFPMHLHDQVQGIVDRALSGEKLLHFETEVLRSDGMPIPVWLSLTPLFDTAKCVRSVVVIARDVTEQRLAQAALAEVESRLEEGEALAHVGSWLWDLRTGAVQWSAEFHRIHGLDPTRFDGTLESHMEAIHPDDRSRVLAAMRSSIESRLTFEIGYRVVRPDGEVRLLEVRAHPTLGSAGAPVGLRGIGKDVSGPSQPA
jgi:PAS domain S-box-containing protein